MAKTAAEIPGPDGGGEFHQNQEIFNFINSDQIRKFDFDQPKKPKNRTRTKIKSSMNKRETRKSESMKKLERFN